MDTAGIVAGRLQLPVSTDDRLMEVGSGVCEGLTSDEIEIQWPGFIAWRSEDRWARAPEGGETYGAARERLVAFAEDFDLSRQMTSEDDAALLVVWPQPQSGYLTVPLAQLDGPAQSTYPANSTPLRIRNGDRHRLLMISIRYGARSSSGVELSSLRTALHHHLRPLTSRPRSGPEA